MEHVEVSPATDRFEFNSEKFKELALYIAQKSENDPTFGAVKLNKVLYYADFGSYRISGKPITGAKYRKLREGPAPVEFRELDKLPESEDAIIDERVYFTGLQKRLVCRRDPNLELFKREELDLVLEVIDYFWGKTAREVSDFSHREPGWELSEDGAVIPYETAWLSPEPICQEDEEWLRGL